MCPPDSGQAVPKVNTPGACHKGISDTGELMPRIRSIFVEFNHQVERAISTPRLGTYRSEASSDDHAWALYRWNIHLAAAVVPLAADLEVTLRNTIHDRLTNHFDRPDWWASTSLLLDDVTAEMLTEVVRKHQKEIIKRTVGPGKVIADTTLGVWVHLLGRGGHSALGRAIDYETRLWRPALRFGFSTGHRHERDGPRPSSPAGEVPSVTNLMARATSVLMMSDRREGMRVEADPTAGRQPGSAL